jgi:beta-mannanase
LSAFIRLDSSTTAQTVKNMQAAAMTPFITLEPWRGGFRSGDHDPGDSLAQLADGRYDAQLVKQARALTAYHGPIYFRFAHEMNAPWYPWGSGTNGNTAREFVNVWRHVHVLFSNISGLDLRWVWSPLSVQSTGANAPLAPLYPGDNYVDYLGLTGYEHVAATAAATFDQTLTELGVLSRKPIILSEIGADGPNKSKWLGSLGDYLVHRAEIAGFVYFDTTQASTGATGDYAVHGSTEEDAFGLSLAKIGATPTTRSGD